TSVSYSCTRCTLLFSIPPTRPPPTSTLFPYTTLFRSIENFKKRKGAVKPLVPQITQKAIAGFSTEAVLKALGNSLDPLVDVISRSEEHTSELQSRENLVCRLLLEKKKTNQMTTSHRRH